MSIEKSPMVSVIVLTYNQSETIGRALDSVLSQQCDFEYEIVVSDDASTDGTRDICEQYAQRYPGKIRLLPAVPNRGLVKNYFDTLRECRGAYIADCAGDDYWCDPLHLQDKVAILQQQPEVTIVCADWYCQDVKSGCKILSDPSGANRDLHKPIVPGRSMMIALLQHRHPSPIFLSASVYRGDVIREAMKVDKTYLFDDTMPCEDYPIYCALLNHGDVAWIDTPAVVYSVGRDSISSPDSMRRTMQFYMASALMTAKLARRYGVPLRLLRKTLKELTRYVMSQAYHLKDKNAAQRIDVAFREAGLPVGWKYRIMLMLTNL